ncbi:MAG: ribonuclease III [Dehalococcoidia bacterium]|nr:ribonuclease III [Dehalococcoidia bacterium]|tara:strand:+ start:21206 stop:21877 length:672 start_codon:yes stop_codon:yes gene_type:complete
MFELIQKLIHEDFDNFKVALTHSSYLNENSTIKDLESNERLEYLGDSVISYVVSEYLYKHYPSLPEGDLSKIRSEVVNQKSLSNYSKDLQLGRYIILGKGEEMNNGRNKISTLCNLFESVIGYISISIGLHETSNYLVDLFKDQIGDIYNSKSYFDSKSLLQEKLQELGEELPVYKSQQLENGSFLIKLFINDKKISIGKGRKKIDAEKMAAKEALEIYSKKL